MSRMLAGPLAALALLVVLPGAPAQAQGSGSVEFGLDAAVGVRFFDDLETPVGTFDVDELVSFQIPLQSFRAGIFVGLNTQVEPALSFTLLSQGGDELTALGLGFGVVQNFQAGGGGSIPFVRGGFTLDWLDVDGESDSQFGIFAGGGVRLPAGDRWGVRMGADVARRFESDDFLGSWDLRGSFGLSFFTR